MDSTTLKITIGGQEVFLSCRRREKFCVGSAPDCKLSIDDDEIEEEHCEIERLPDDRFFVKSIQNSLVTLNGISTTHSEVEVPFELSIGRFELGVDLVPDEVAEGFENIPIHKDPREVVLADKEVEKSVVEKQRVRYENSSNLSDRINYGSFPRRAAIPALRFACSASFLSPVNEEKAETSSYLSIPIPTARTRAPRRRPKVSGPPETASSGWFVAALSLLVLLAMVGTGWFYWRSYSLPGDEARLRELIEERDLSAMAILGLGQLWGPRSETEEWQSAVDLIKKSADGGDPLGLLALGFLSDQGFKIGGKTDEGAKYWRAAFSAGLVDAIAESPDPRWGALAARAELALTGEISEQGLLRLEKAARRRVVSAMITLAQYTKEESRSEDWFRRAGMAAKVAAFDESPTAMRHLAQLHLDNRLEDSDWRYGNDLLERASFHGDPLSHYLYAKVIQEDDPEDAFRLFESASNVGHIPSRAKLAECYLHGRGTRSDPDKALILAEDVLSTGSNDANVVIATIESNEKYGSLNLLRAETLARAVAETDPAAKAILGKIYMRQERFEEAASQLQEAAASGRGEACFDLGMMHADKKIPHANLRDAVKWLETAKRAGHGEAVRALLDIVDQDGKVGADPARAIELLEELVQDGDEKAAVRLSERLLDIDPSRSLLLLKKAADAGEDSAWYPLAKLYETGIENVLAPSPEAALLAYRKALQSRDSRIALRFSGIESAKETALQFLDTWESNDPRATTEMLHGNIKEYFHYTDGDLAGVATLESGFRSLWTRRSILSAEVREITIESLGELGFSLVFEVALTRDDRRARGKGELKLGVAASNGRQKITRVKEENMEWQLSPSPQRFRKATGSRQILPAIDSEGATWTLSHIPRNLIENARQFPLVDKFGNRHILIPSSRSDGVIIFSQIDREGDLILPQAYFEKSERERMDKIIDSHFFDLFEKEYRRILFKPDQRNPRAANLLRRAEAGDHEAQAVVGANYYDGIDGFPIDRLQAVRWFDRSRRGGNLLGKSWIAIMSATGKVKTGVPASEQFLDLIFEFVPIISQEDAKPEYWRAAGECVAGAGGTTLDDRNARELIDRGVKSGDLRSQLLLGQHLLKKGSSEGIRYLRHAADGNCATAAAELGLYYIDEGNDPRLAIPLLERAAAANHFRAQFVLGICYSKAYGVEKDPNRAAFWLETALRTALTQRDKALETEARKAIREAKQALGEDAFRRAVNFIEKKGR